MKSFERKCLTRVWVEIGTGRSVSISVLTMAVCESNFHCFQACKASLALWISSEKCFLDVQHLFLWHKYACRRLNVQPHVQACYQEGLSSIAISFWMSKLTSIDMEESTLVFLYADVREVRLERHVYVELWVKHESACIRKIREILNDLECP